MSETPISTDQSEFVAAQRALTRGKCICRRCRIEYPARDVLAVMYGGALAYAICVTCFSEADVVMTRHDTGIQIEHKRRGLVIVQGHDR